jgi:hypothetical protein
LSEFTKAAIVMFGNAVVFPSPSSRLCLLSAMYRTAKRNNGLSREQMSPFLKMAVNSHFRFRGQSR